jgi:AcrR family transcriptional regulator
MPQLAPPKRTTFRHGNLPDALMEAALRRLETDGVAAITVRELARDTGVNHRAIYRHFPDKASLMAHVAERCWKDFIRHLKKSIANKPPGDPMLIAAGVALYVYGRDHPNIFHFGGRARGTFGDEYPRVEAAAMEALQIFAVGFAGTGMAPDFVIWRASVYMTSLQGIVTQILRRRFYLAPEHAIAWMTDTCAMLIRGLKEGPGESALFRQSDN